MATNQDFKVKNGMKLGGSISLYDNAAPTNGQLLIGNTTNSDFQAGTLTQGTGIVITNGAGTITVATNGVSTNTVSTLVLRDASGNFSAGTITASLTGTASLATSLAGGSGNQVVYQSAANTSAFVSNAAGVLQAATSGAVPTWTTTPTLTGTNFTGIPNAGLTNSSLTLGSTSMALGSTTTTVAGLTSVTSTTFVGALTGNASTATSATSATTATNATNVGITNDVATATSVFPVWVTANTGNLPAKVSSTALSFVPSTGSLTATTFVGALTGTASLATNIAAGAAGNILYQSGAGVTAKLTTGTSSQVLVSGTTPAWTNTPTLTGTNFTGIPNTGLTNSSVTIGSTSISLGATATTIAGLTSVTSTTFVGALTGNASTATSATSATTATTASASNVLNFADGTTWPGGSTSIASTGSRATDLAPNTFVKVVAAEFKNSSLFSNTGNYTGLLTFAPWQSTTASTGDPAYQLSFNPTAANSTAAPVFKIRAGIDTTWGAWSTILHSSNFNTYAPTLTGTGASGTWSITASNASTLTNLAPSSSATASTVATRDGNGYLYAVYLNQSSANSENPTISQVMTTNGTDNFLRKSSIASLSASLTGVPNSALTNSSLTLGSTSMALGSTTTTVAGLTSLTATNLLGATSDSTFVSITNPGGANYNGASTTTGALAITLPVGMTSSMVRMTIKIFDYATNEAFTVYCGGYNYATGNTWANNPFAYIVGNPNTNRNFTVRFGYTAGAKAVVYIGELASTWAYPQVTVTDVQVGFGGRSSTWLSGWSIGVQATAFENVTATISSPQIGYQATANTASTVVLRDGSGNFSAGTITASLTGAASLNVLKTGDTMTGTLTLTNSAPTTNPALSSTAGTIRSVDDVNANGSNFLVNTTTKSIASFAYDVQRSSATVGGIRVDGSSLFTTITATALNSAAATALSVTSGTTGALTLDSGSTGAVNLGTNANAKTVTIGNTTGATSVVMNSGTAGVTFNQVAAGVFKVQASAAPTTDMVQFTNTGFPIVTAGVNALNVTYVGGAAAVEASAARIDITPGTTTGGIWSALRVVPSAAAATGVTQNGIKFQAITAGAGTDNALWVGTGWDTILSYNGTTVINGSGQVNAAQLTGTVPDASLTGSYTGLTSVTSTTFVGALTGNASSATNTGITDDTTTNATVYPTWVTTTTGNLPQKVSSTKMTFNPSTGQLTTIKAVINPNTTGVSTGLTCTNGDITTYRSGGTTGVIYLSSSGSNYLYWDATNYNLNGGGLIVTGDVTAFSDARLKKDVQVIPDALTKVEALRGVTFERTDTDDGKRHTGVIAQEVQAVLPEAVMEGETLSVAYGNMVGLLIEAIKDLSAQNKALLARVEALESKE